MEKETSLTSTSVYQNVARKVGSVQPLAAMHPSVVIILLVLGYVYASISPTPAKTFSWNSNIPQNSFKVQVGSRPYFLIDSMDDGALKQKLMSCSEQTPKVSKFVMGHRGAPLKFPELTRQSLIAAARQGAGGIECDVTFTSDKKLVCRHDQSVHFRF
jgi:glycerophosphoryl diester phosphodiesterase